VRLCRVDQYSVKVYFQILMVPQYSKWIQSIRSQYIEWHRSGSIWRSCLDIQRGPADSIPIFDGRLMGSTFRFCSNWHQCQIFTWLWIKAGLVCLTQSSLLPEQSTKPNKCDVLQKRFHHSLGISGVVLGNPFPS
jgi:hypothetical protein